MSVEVWRGIAARDVGGGAFARADGAAGPPPHAGLLVVGEQNPYGADPQYALYPAPPESAGGRMRELGLFATRVDQIAAWRANLCTGGWSATAAAARAQELLAGPWTTYVLLGKKVQGAFRSAVIKNRVVADGAARRVGKAHAYQFATTWWWVLRAEGVIAAVDLTGAKSPTSVRHVRLDVVRAGVPVSVAILETPHPSGLCREWNKSVVREAAQAAFRAACAGALP